MTPDMHFLSLCVVALFIFLVVRVVLAVIEYRTVEIKVTKFRSVTIYPESVFKYRVWLKYKEQTSEEIYNTIEDLEEDVCRLKQSFKDTVNKQTAEDLRIKEILKRCKTH